MTEHQNIKSSLSEERRILHRFADRREGLDRFDESARRCTKYRSWIRRTSGRPSPTS